MTTPRSMLLILAKENEVNIKHAIILITGFCPVEKITLEKYTLKLGIVDPIVINYDRMEKLMFIRQMRRSALVALLRKICELLKDPGEFIIWSVKNKTFINQQN